MGAYTAVLLLVLLPLCSCRKADLAKSERDRLRAIGLMVESYRMSRGSYPRTLETARDFYPDVSLVDSWGTAVEYSAKETSFRVTSAGLDRAFGTSDDLSIDSGAIRDLVRERRPAKAQSE